MCLFPCGYWCSKRCWYIWLLDVRNDGFEFLIFIGIEFHSFAPHTETAFCPTDVHILFTVHCCPTAVHCCPTAVPTAVHCCSHLGASHFQHSRGSTSLKKHCSPEIKIRKTKIIIVLLTNVRFYVFSVNRSENDLHLKYRNLSGSAENLYPPSIIQIEQDRLFHCI